jgi:hypothetical protein
LYRTLLIEIKFGSLAPGAPRNQSDDYMKQVKKANSGRRLTSGVRGKYYRQAMAGSNVVLIEPDLSALFPDSDSVNRALRLLADTAQAATTKKGRRPTG